MKTGDSRLEEAWKDGDDMRSFEEVYAELLV